MSRATSPRAHRLLVPIALLVLPTLISLTACAPPPAAKQIDRGVLILDATLLSPERPSPLLRADVAIEGDRIVAVGTDLVPGAGVEVIDGEGRFLVPGLIDGHVHVGHPMVLDDAALEEQPALLDDYRRQVPRSYLYFGFTTVVDLDLDLRPEAGERFRAAPEHPRLFHCGRGIRVAGGYGPAFFSPEVALRIFPSLVHEPTQAEHWPSTLDAADYAPDRAVARVADAGAVCVKSYVEPGFGGAFDWPVPTVATLRALREEAKAQGLPLLLHATDLTGWRAAIEAGADAIVHGMWHWPGDRRQSRPPAEAVEVLEAAIGAGIAIQPTVQVLAGEEATYHWSPIDDPRLVHALPPSLIAYAGTEAGQSTRRALVDLYARVNPYPDTPAEALFSAMNERVTDGLARLSAGGARLSFGSDTPAQEGLGNPPGLNGLLELEQWQAAGVPATAMLEAATSTNARVFGLDEDLGTVEVGKLADLLLLRENPLEDASAYDSIELVFLGGRPVPRDLLSATRMPE